MPAVNYESSGLMSSKLLITSRSSKATFIDDNYANGRYYFYAPLQAPKGFSFLCTLNDASIPATWYLISEYNGNNSLKYTINTIQYEYTIPDGSYGAYDLKTQLNSGIPFTVTYNSITNKYTFSHTTNDFTFDSDSTCLNELGFTEETTHSSTTQSLTSDKKVDLAGTRSLYIITNLHTLNMDSRTGQLSSNILDNIIVDVASYGLITYVNTSGFRTIILNDMISYLDIRIEDDAGSLINLTEHYTMTLEFHVVENKMLAYRNILTDSIHTNGVFQESEARKQSIRKSSTQSK